MTTSLAETEGENARIDQANTLGIMVEIHTGIHIMGLNT